MDFHAVPPCSVLPSAELSCGREQTGHDGIVREIPWGKSLSYQAVEDGHRWKPHQEVESLVTGL